MIAPSRGFLAGDRSVEADVVDQEPVHVVERGEHLHHLLGDRGQLITAGALGRQPREVDFDHSPRLEELRLGYAMQRGEEGQGIDVEQRRSVRHKGPGTAPRLHHPDRGQRAQTGAHARPADSDQLSQLTLGRQLVTNPDLSALDQPSDVGHDEMGRRR